MATSYRPTSWGNEYISSDKLNVMTSNDQYLFERTPTVYYNAYGVNKRTGGMKIAAGVVVIPANKKLSAATKNYHFGSFFSQGCKPIVATSMSMTKGGRYHVVVKGLSSMTPDHRGMRIDVIANEHNWKNSRINTRIYVNFIAVGW